MKYNELKEYLLTDKLDSILAKITGNDDLSLEKERYLKLLEEAYKLYGDGDYHFISSPGRSEIGGNHTDHQHGHVLAAALNIDNLCVLKKNDTNIVNYLDKTFRPIKVDVADLDIQEAEINTTESLIRGIASRLKQLGYEIAGFDALCDSHVLVGSGISSSACFEVLIVEAFNGLFNDEKISDVDRAIISQYAENVYFGKPSGLMDQMAISVGGFVGIDFKDPNKPIINNCEFSFSEHNHELFLVNTKGDHADLSDEYAAVPNEIKDVGKCLGVDYLADSSLQELLKNINKIRAEVKNDRAILRSIHFYNEDARAIQERKAVENNDINSLLTLMKQSGRSSFEYLQNVYPASRPKCQALALGLCIADNVLDGRGAYRVHGGGFDGTIQVVVPNDKIAEFRQQMCSLFGQDCLLQVKIRPFGTKLVI